MSRLLGITSELEQSDSVAGRAKESLLARQRLSASQWLLLLLLAVYLSFAAFKLGSSELGIDEGRFGVSAINIFSDYHQAAIVSEDPLGEPGTKPYGYPLLLGMAMWALGKTEFALRAVNVVALAIAALLLYGFLVLLLGNRTVALLTFALFLLNPGTLTYARTAMPEPVVVASGCLGLFCAAKFMTQRAPFWAGACGFALGFGFLSKMWLVLPLVLACFSILALKLLTERKRVLLVGFVLAFFSFLLVATSHLFLVLWLAPQSWSHWLGMYFLVSFGSRVAGSGYDPEMWYRPWWFYLAAVFKASFFGLPLLFLGMFALKKRINPSLVAVVLSLLSPVFIFSLFRVKVASYIYPAYPALALLIGLGWIYLVRDAQPRELALASLLSVGAGTFFYIKGVFGPREFAALGGLYFLYLIAALARSRFNRLAQCGIATACLSALFFADALVVKQSIQPPTYYPEIAAYFRPQLASQKPQDVAFTAPAHPAMQFYTFRSGEYWETFYVKKSAAEVTKDLRSGARTFYVVDPSQALYGSKISPEKLEALREYGVDVTEEIERKLGHAIPLRLYVPRAGGQR